MLTKHLLAAFSGITLSLTASAAWAIGPAGLINPSTVRPQSIVSRDQMMPPAPFVKFCISNFGDCMAGASNFPIDLSKEQLRELRSVNLKVNRAIMPQNDPPGEDNWDADVTAGDCEDYVLTKRRKLMQMGWSPNALRIAVAYTPSNTGHAVLVVSTTKGDLVLDNRNNAVLNWRDTDLRWVMIQSSQNPLLWNRINDQDDNSVLATASN